MAYGNFTSNKLDQPLKKLSVVSQYLGDNGYKFTGANQIHVLSFANGSTATYDETAASDAFGTISLATPSAEDFTIAYNKSMATRFQKTQTQDVPIDGLAAKWAAQQISEVFIPEHDAYSLAKLYAARPAANRISFAYSGIASDTSLSLYFEQAVNKARVAGQENTSQMIAWISYTYAAYLAKLIQYTGSDAGYADAKAGYLGKHKGVICVETPDSYFTTGVFVIIADKRAVINVTPKMAPEDFVILDKLSGFSGYEVQIRDRADTFVLSKKAVNIATIEDSASTTTTTTTTTTTGA